MDYVRDKLGRVFISMTPEDRFKDDTPVVVIDKDKWDRLVELLTADLPWERHRIMDLIEEVGK